MRRVNPWKASKNLRETVHACRNVSAAAKYIPKDPHHQNVESQTNKNRMRPRSSPSYLSISSHGSSSSVGENIHNNKTIYHSTNTNVAYPTSTPHDLQQSQRMMMKTQDVAAQRSRSERKKSLAHDASSSRASEEKARSIKEASMKEPEFHPYGDDPSSFKMSMTSRIHHLKEARAASEVRPHHVEKNAFRHMIEQKAVHVCPHAYVSLNEIIIYIYIMFQVLLETRESLTCSWHHVEHSI